MLTKSGPVVSEICASHGDDRSRLMDIAMAIQSRLGCVDAEAVDVIAERTGAPRVDVDGLVSFYGFLSSAPTGKVVIRLCNDVIDEMQGAGEVATALEQELGIRAGETTSDGEFTLERASCIGMCDQAPAAMVNDVIVTDLKPESARALIRTLKKADGADDLRPLLVESPGDGNNGHELVNTMVRNNLRRSGEVLFAETNSGVALENAVAKSPEDVIAEVKAARLRGRGGAGFPTGMKWEFTRAAGGDRRYLICNADEGEPGTFKDRVLLTERPDLVFEGMTVGGYAIGAQEGIVYLRGEYAYLRAFLEDVLSRRRAAGLLGKNVAGKQGFDFDIRIQMGAGAYICGEETSLINSCEGLRGDPRNRPPFPAQQGYLGYPTSVNNVETLCCAARILERGASWFASIGSDGSSGTKALSISGDCKRPGVYEVPFGTPLRDMLELCGAGNTAAVQVGGPSGKMIGEEAFGRTICFDDLATGGALMVFDDTRDILEIVSRFMGFFVHESCGYCTPCRVGNVLLKERVDKVRAGQAQASDIDYLIELGQTVKTASRCGLGQTSPHPVLTTIENFRGAYESRLVQSVDGRLPSFDLREAVKESERLSGRRLDDSKV
ncbi:MAG: NADH:ubiquinone oxidoreductase [bacterium]|nr:NADH:ubiquinone oxidoreductase [bacterium]